MKTKAVEVGERIIIELEVRIANTCDDKTGGRWYCTTHRKMLLNNLEKDVHTYDRRSHRLAWFCLEHSAYEAPGPQK